MICNSCNVDMQKGVAMVPVWGTLDGRPLDRGTTLNQIHSRLEDVMKCPDCGHSVFMGGMIVHSFDEKSQPCP